MFLRDNVSIGFNLNERFLGETLTPIADVRATGSRFGRGDSANETSPRSTGNASREILESIIDLKRWYHSYFNKSTIHKSKPS